jgi:DNA-binding CsgD family transcriptional regulator/tetratricopeptide (TPR) repeat protein
LRHLARDALAGTLTTLGRWADALQVDEHLEQDPNRLSRMAGNAAQAGQLDRATELVARATAAGAAREPLLALTALVALWRGELDNAEDAAKEALASSADAATECAALDVLGRAADARGRRDAARDAFRRWAERAGAAGLTAQRLQALMELGNLDFMSGGPDEGLRQARALAMDSNAFTTLVLADLSLVWWLGHRARLHEAASLADEAVDLCRRFELGLLPHALVAAGWARNLAAWEAGEALVTEALAIAPGDHDIEILASWTRGDCALRAGRYEVAAERYDAGVQVMRRSPAGVPPPVPFMRAIAIIAARGPDGSAALEEARESPALARLYVNRPWLAFAEALFARASVEEALAAFEANGVFNLAVGLVVGAGLLRDTGASLRRALEVFVDAGADDDAARVRGMLRAAGLPVPRARSMVAGLPGELASRGVTRREADVLQLVADGLSNAQIAQRLFLSVRTVEGNVSQLLRKLQATNRAALVAAGLRLRS